MIEIYPIEKEQCQSVLEMALLRHIPAPIEILHTENGKPYVAGNGVFFSLSHSGDKAVIAINDRPIGVDLEIYRQKDRAVIISRFTERERAEITCERDFLEHWTAREGYVKLYGLTIAAVWAHAEYFGGALYVDGKLADVRIRHYDLGYGIAAVCTENRR